MNTFPCYRRLRLISFPGCTGAPINNKDEAGTIVKFTSEREGYVVSNKDVQYNPPIYYVGYCSKGWTPFHDMNTWEPVNFANDSKDYPKFSNHPNHTRFLKVKFMEDGVEKTMDLEVRYLGESNADNGCMLDKIVMPAIKEKLGVDI